MTRWENTLRGNSPAAWNAAKMQCLRGHPFNEENTYRHNGKRLCRECRRLLDRERKRRARAAA